MKKITINKSAFTLVELLVVMGIISILLAISAFGIALVQRNSRNTQRASLANELKVGIEKFYTNFGRYPQVTTDALTSNICHNAGTSSVVVYSGIFEEDVAYRNTMLIPGATSSRTDSAYCYARSNNGLYSLQYLNETSNGTRWSLNLGTWNQVCEGTVLTLPAC